MNLSEANLVNVDLSDAILVGADLTNANLNGARLKNVRLNEARLSGASLINVDLDSANLSDADLRGANLINARMRSADLRGTQMADAQLSLANVDGALFEPKSLPELRGVAAAQNLELITFKRNPDALFQLRKQFQDAGFLEQERKISYALKKREAELELAACHSWACAVSFLRNILYRLTTQYGLNPIRPLLLVFELWLGCSLIYSFFSHLHGPDWLYFVWKRIRSGKENTQGIRVCFRTNRGQPARLRSVARLSVLAGYLLRLFRRRVAPASRCHVV